MSFVLRVNDKRYSLAIKPAVVGSARYCSACERKNQVESTFGEDT
nr:MAG TPA: ssDNA binding protein [Caudoviricetes sp.]